MKTKKLFLMAAMLLMGVCMFAQINTPHKADVNGDGDVDVADMVGVMDIIKNLGHPDGEYKYYLGVVTEEQLTNPETLQEIVNSQIQNSTTTYKGKPSALDLVQGYNLWIYDSKMGQPDVTDQNGFKYSPYTVEDLGISNPEGYTVGVYESSSYTVNVRWLTPHSTSYWDAGFEYSEGDVDNNGVVNEEDLNVVKENMKVASTLEGVKYGWFFLTEDKVNELWDNNNNNRLSEWVEEQMSHLNGVYTCLPSKLYVPKTGEKGYYFWIYPTSLGIVEKITDRNETGLSFFTASDLSITPPQGYGVFLFDSSLSSFFKIIWNNTLII